MPNIDDLTPFELFQLQRYGNILPVKKSFLELDEQDERDRFDERQQELLENWNDLELFGIED